MRKLPINKDLWDLEIFEDNLFYKVGQNSFYSFNWLEEHEITEQEYIRVKYLRDFKLKDSDDSIGHLTNGNTIRCFYQDSIIREYDQNNEVIRTFSEETAMMTIYHLDTDERDNIWFVEPTVHRVAQLDYSTGKLLFELGGTWEEDGELNHPEDIKIYGDHAFVSDMGNQRIVTVNLRTKELLTYRQFDKPTWQYRRTINKEIVRLQDGLYEL
jgi:hypothetical protein